MPSDYFEKRWKPGTLVKISVRNKNIVGIVIGIENSMLPIYGDGLEENNRVWVKWFDKKYSKTAAYTSPEAYLKIIGKVT